MRSGHAVGNCFVERLLFVSDMDGPRSLFTQSWFPLRRTSTDSKLGRYLRVGALTRTGDAETSIGGLVGEFKASCFKPFLL